jgi:hypothetical protein
MSPTEFKLACRKRMPVALAVLDQILSDPTSSTTSRLAAVVQLAERAYGKAPVIEEANPNRSAKDMSTDELLALTRADLEAKGVDVDGVLARVRNERNAHA